MADPKRWLQEDGGATDAERALLREARGSAPTKAQRDAVWAGVMGQVGGGGGGGSGGADGASGAGGGAGVAGNGASRSAGSIFKIGGAIIVVVAGLWFYFGGARPPRAPASPADTVAIAVTPSASTAQAIDVPAKPTGSASADEPVATASVPSAVAQPPSSTAGAPLVAASNPSVAPSTSASASSSLATRLREESALIEHARNALRVGSYPAAQGFLDTARTKFPNGVLVQERKALEIETLYRSGKRAAAAAMADEFLEKYPGSPHAAKVREFQHP